MPDSVKNPLRAVLAVRHVPLANPVPISTFPAEAFDEDQRNKIAFKAMILLARESTQGRVFPMSFEEIDAIALLALDLMPDPPTYFGVLAIFDVRNSVVLMDKFDGLERLIIGAVRDIRGGSNPEEVVRQLYTQITNIAATSVSVATTTSEEAPDTEKTRESKLKDFLAAVKEFNEAVDKPDSGVPQSIRHTVKLLNDEVTKLMDAPEE